MDLMFSMPEPRIRSYHTFGVYSACVTYTCNNLLIKMSTLRRYTTNIMLAKISELCT